MKDEERAGDGQDEESSVDDEHREQASLVGRDALGLRLCRRRSSRGQLLRRLALLKETLPPDEGRTVIREGENPRSKQDNDDVQESVLFDGQVEDSVEQDW